MDGILLVDKPQGWTSYDVVDFVKKRFRIKKAGHTGTLDPQATGLLVLLLGRATKLSGKLTDQDKEYEGFLCLGKMTKTGDSDGEVISVKDTSALREDDIRKAFSGFSGEIEQIPPMVSAGRYKGERLYKIARRGLVVPRNPRKVVIYKLEILSLAIPNVKFRVHCSKGTYIRTLCEDIGAKLGVGGYSSSLTRTAVGRYKLADALKMEELKEMNETELARRLISLPKPSSAKQRTGWGEVAVASP